MHAPVPAYILAGGRSSRFGSDKARALLDGQPLLGQVAALCGQVCRPVLAVGRRAGEYEDLGLETIGDLRPGGGPLAGLEAALEHAARQGASWLLALGCDQLGLQAAWLRGLLAAAAPGLIAVAFRAERWQPLPALYHRDALPVVRALLAGAVPQGRTVAAPRTGTALWRVLAQGPSAALALPDGWAGLRDLNRPPA